MDMAYGGPGREGPDRRHRRSRGIRRFGRDPDRRRPRRRVAAEARRVLLTGLVAARGPGRTVDGQRGRGVGAEDPSRRVNYGELLAPALKRTLSGENINATTGTAPLKAVQDLKMVGQSPQRDDIPPKVDGSLRWAVDVKLPGMVHARNVKPPFAGATLVSVDESSVKAVPGLVRVVSKGNYVAVVCEREEHAIQAARQLKVEWKKPAVAPFPTSENLFDYMRSATPTSMGMPTVAGNPTAAMAASAKRVEAEPNVPLHGAVAIARPMRWTIRRTGR